MIRARKECRLTKFSQSQKKGDKNISLPHKTGSLGRTLLMPPPEGGTWTLANAEDWEPGWRRSYEAQWRQIRAQRQGTTEPAEGCCCSWWWWLGALWIAAFWLAAGLSQGGFW